MCRLFGMFVFAGNLFCCGGLGAWGQGLAMHGDAGPAPVYLKVRYLLTEFRAVAGWHAPVMPARYVCLGRELIIEEGAGIMVGGHA